VLGFKARRIRASAAAEVIDRGNRATDDWRNGIPAGFAVSWMPI
jgi:hypothetical protein